MLIGYPVLRNDAVQKLAGVGGHSFSIDGMTPGLLVLIVVLIPIWLLLTYGIRIVWMARATRRFGALLREANLLELTVLLSIAVGLAIALFAAPERTPLLVYYNCLFGLLVTTPFTAIVLDEYLRRLSSLARLAVVGLVLVQMSSGFLYLAKPLLQKKNIADLRGPWLDAMTYLRRETPPDALLLSNRYGFSTDPAFGTYSEQFYFVPAFSHRSVAVSGNRYYLQVGAEYDRRRRLADSLFGARSGERIRDLSDSLGIDYIVFDKWKGERFAGNDPRYLEQVFSNKQVDIYKVRRDATALPVRSDSTTTSER
jgi:hypothetical protein